MKGRYSFNISSSRSTASIEITLTNIPNLTGLDSGKYSKILPFPSLDKKLFNPIFFTAYGNILNLFLLIFIIRHSTRQGI